MRKWGRRRLYTVSPASPSPRVLGEENLSECVSELGAEDGVDDGVEEAVEVAQPQPEAVDDGRDDDLVPDEGARQLHDEEGQPAEQEGPRDDGQGARRFLLPLLLQLLALPAAGEAGLARPVPAGHRPLHHGRGGVRLDPVGVAAFAVAVVVPGRVGAVVLVVQGAAAAFRQPVLGVALQVVERRHLLLAVRRAPVAVGHHGVLVLCRRQGDLLRDDGARGRAGSRGLLAPLLVEFLLPDPPPGNYEDARVDADHDEHGQVEGAHGGEDGVAVVLRDDAHTGDGRVVIGVPPAEQRGDGDGEGRHPHRQNHQQNAARAAPANVVYGSDGPVTVHGDGYEVQDGGRAA